VRGIDRFEGRSSFKTWLFGILVNRARSASSHEHSELPIDTVHAVDPLRSTPTANGQIPSTPGPRTATTASTPRPCCPRSNLRSKTFRLVNARSVLLRDVEGLSHDEACGVLGISIGNQRILLHRGRTRLREILERQIEKVD